MRQPVPLLVLSCVVIGFLPVTARADEVIDIDIEIPRLMQGLSASAVIW
jgi:hypothetical protein